MGKRYLVPVRIPTRLRIIYGRATGIAPAGSGRAQAIARDERLLLY